MEDVIKIETVVGKKPVYKVEKKTLALLKNYMGGWFRYRDEDEVIEVQPINDKSFKIMKTIPGITEDSFEYLRDE
ncbi:MAG: hypothetical protein ACFFKA_00190 [Candidatus Thorarchaeota archaeon]